MSVKVHKLPLPTPFDVGEVNGYLIQGERTGLVDPGPAMEETYHRLVELLRNHGVTLGQVDYLLITHPHLDHFGLAGRVAEEAGAEVCAHREAGDILEDFSGHYRRERAYFEPFLQRMGMPEDVATTVTELPDSYTRLGASVQVDQPLGEDQSVPPVPALTCVDSPGHAPGSMSFLHASGGVCFTGDHVLEHISPNPLLQMPDDGKERPRSLLRYQQSLTRLRERIGSARVKGFGGHGPDMGDLSGRISEILRHHEKRKTMLERMLDEPATAYELMNRTFPELPLREYFLGMSEIIGHMDLLEREERVKRQHRDEVEVYVRRD